MGLRKTSYDSLSRLEECTSFQNPFTGSRNADQGLWRGFLTAGSEKGAAEAQLSQQGSVDPWRDAVPARARTGSLRGCQRGSSAAMAVPARLPTEQHHARRVLEAPSCPPTWRSETILPCARS